MNFLQHKLEQKHYKGIYCFTDDLRLQDNIALASTIAQCHEIAFIYIVDPQWFKPTNYHHTWLGQAKWQFILQSLECLNNQLEQYGHHLTLLHGEHQQTLSQVIKENQINLVGYARQTGTLERNKWQNVAKHYTTTTFYSVDNTSLFEQDSISVDNQILASFSRFRRYLEKHNISVEPPRKIHLDALPKKTVLKNQARFNDVLNSLPYFRSKASNATQHTSLIMGGEINALKHCKQYFGTPAPLTYKTTRNALDGVQSSTKFSPYLASGNVSARQLVQQLKYYEAANGANESTYWIFFELLWREYFHRLAFNIGNSLYRFTGLASTAPNTSFFPERFNKWCAGNTPYPIVNACMKQLNQTGFMSNRGRQLVASCLVNELSLDWRYGAAYFQQQLIDHDIASNWGNWQYIAGVGVDPRGGRHFNLEKQTSLYDPEHVFIKNWSGQIYDASLDSTDCADWPIESPEKEH